MRKLSLLPAFFCLFILPGCDSSSEEPDIPTIEEATFADGLDAE